MSEASEARAGARALLKLGQMPSADQIVRLLDVIDRQELQITTLAWRAIGDGRPPEGEMFIWGYKNLSGKWSIGLAYWTVSGTWGDLNLRATHWKPIGAIPT